MHTLVPKSSSTRITHALGEKTQKYLNKVVSGSHATHGLACYARHKDVECMLASLCVSAVVLLSPPAYASSDIPSLVVDPPAPELAGAVLTSDLPGITEDIQKQPTGAVQQAAEDVKQLIEQQAQTMADDNKSKEEICAENQNAPECADEGSPTSTPQKAAGVGSSQDTEQAKEGLKANLGQLKSILGIK